MQEPQEVGRLRAEAARALRIAESDAALAREYKAAAQQYERKAQRLHNWNFVMFCVLILWTALSIIVLVTR